MGTFFFLSLLIQIISMAWTSVYDELTRRGVMVVSDTLHWQSASILYSTVALLMILYDEKLCQ